METLHIGRWTVQVDVERTLEAHSQLTTSGAVECGCAGCMNFDAQRADVLSGRFGSLLAALGIRPPWEVEVVNFGEVESGLHAYSLWYHFVGTVVSGAPAWKPVEGPTDMRAQDFEPQGGWSVGCHTEARLVRPSFRGLALVQLEFSLELPWVLANKPHDVQAQFFAGQRTQAVRFVLNDVVEIVSGPHAGRKGAVVSLVRVDPEPAFVVELIERPFADLEVPQSSILLVEP